MSGIFSRSGPPSADGAITPARTRMTLELRHNSPLLSCRFDPTGRFVLPARRTIRSSAGARESDEGRLRRAS